MQLPPLQNRRAIYFEDREARAVIIDRVSLKGELVEFRIKADLRIPHMRVWRGEGGYQARHEPDSAWILSATTELIVLHDNFAQGPMSGWQLLIDAPTVEQFAAQDDSWVEAWFG
ncbi:MAG: hypothetical protein ACFB12_20215 [Leptolyngbyaceae cyanobacterium]